MRNDKPFRYEIVLTGVAALEPRESVAAVGHVVAPLQRGYVAEASASVTANLKDVSVGCRLDRSAVNLTAISWLARS